ncbi:MAG: hypothetical protein IJ689_07795 [Alphaproteobacteria bacterium]|nr:hypothetical protein [Alphaproteobacteria bacterium]MBR1649477.1 hypothetical protein [Alphaproteobacteria bacterium]
MEKNQKLREFKKLQVKNSLLCAVFALATVAEFYAVGLGYCGQQFVLLAMLAVMSYFFVCARIYAVRCQVLKEKAQREAERDFFEKLHAISPKIC